MRIGENLSGFFQEQVLTLGIALRHMIEIEPGHAGIPCHHSRLRCGHMSRFSGEGSVSMQKRRLTNQAIGALRHTAEFGKIHRIADVDELFAGLLRTEHVIGVDELSTGTLQTFSGEQSAALRAVRECPGALPRQVKNAAAVFPETQTHTTA